MKFRPMVWIALGLALVLALVWAGWQPTQAQSAESSCINCHETQAKNPVRAVGAWHVDHSNLSCEICHAGAPSAETQEAAHAGQIVNPLEAGAACTMCHPDDAPEYMAAYQAQVTPATPEPVSSAAPTLPAASATLPGNCRVVATECVAPFDTPVAAPTASPTRAPTAASTSAPTEPPAPAPAAPGGGSAGGAGGLSWMRVLQFSRGPLFQAAFWFCLLGLFLRLVQALRPGWKHRLAADKTGRAAGAGRSFLSGLLVLPFIPGLKGAFRSKPVIYLAGGLFHLGLLGVVLFSKTHMSAFKSQLGFGWPVLPTLVVDWLAAVGILALLALLINRLVDPVLRLISGPAEWLNWLMVFLPMVSGFILARKLGLPYEVSFSIHMLLVDALLVWIPLSRISHFVFYFFSRAIHGVEFNTRRTATP